MNVKLYIPFQTDFLLTNFLGDLPSLTVIILSSVHSQCCMVFHYENKLDLNYLKYLKCQNLLKLPDESINIYMIL